MSPKKRIVDEETERVALNFKRLRKQKGWTLDETARQAKPSVSFKYIGHLEAGTTGLGKRARKKWADIFGVDVSEFLRPISKTDVNHEIALLKDEMQKYSADKIKKLRELAPILLGGENHAAQNNKETSSKTHRTSQRTHS